MNDLVYKAIPVIVNSASAEEESSLETTSSFKSIMELSSDSDKSVERIYNLNSGKVYEKIAEGNQDIINASKLPTGVKTNGTVNKIEVLLDENQNSSQVLTNNLENDPEIQLLKDQQLVKNRLGQFSQSNPILTDSLIYKETPTVANTSIYDLKQKFDSKHDLRNDKSDQIYSLTARSIPSQVRKELQQEPQPETDKVDLDILEPKKVEIVLDDYPVTKSRIEFFEKLNR